MHVLHLLLLSFLAAAAAKEPLAEFKAIDSSLEAVFPSYTTECVCRMLSEYPDVYTEASMEQQGAFDALGGIDNRF